MSITGYLVLGVAILAAIMLVYNIVRLLIAISADAENERRVRRGGR